MTDAGWAVTTMKEPPPLISVIVPCFGQAHLLPEAVASVQAQSVADWELLVIDDGSPDDTAAVAGALAAADPRIRLLRKSNGGLSSARNAGLAQMRGRFVQFLDADDLLLPGKFQRALEAINDLRGLAVAIDDYEFLNADGSTSRTALCKPRFRSSDVELELSLRWELELSIPIHCPLFAGNFFRGPTEIRFDERLPNHEDYAFWMQVTALRPSIVITEQTGALYRINPAGMTRNRRQMYQGFTMAVRARLENAFLRPIVRKALKAKLSVIDNQYGQGLRGRARAILQRSKWRQRLPWPMQRALFEIALLDPLAHQAAVSLKFGVRAAL